VSAEPFLIPFIPPEARPEVMDELAEEAWQVAEALLSPAEECGPK
jgi:hypothetical protein